MTNTLVNLGAIELVLGWHPRIIVWGTGNYNGPYCAETCRPYFTKLMTVRREGESFDYWAGIYSLSQYSLEIVFLWVFSSFDISLIPSPSSCFYR